MLQLQLFMCKLELINTCLLNIFNTYSNNTFACFSFSGEFIVGL